MNLRLKRYKKTADHSYTFGVFPTLELLQHRPHDVIGVILHPKGHENAGIAKIRAICQQTGTPIETQEKTFTRLGARPNDFAIGIFHKTATALDAAANHVILVNPGSMGNLGTIIRTMVGFSLQNLAIIQPAADLYHPDTVRASMGALFQIRAAVFDPFETYREQYPAHNLYCLMTDGTTALPETHFSPPFGLVFGNESSGLAPNFHTLGVSVFIPQNPAIDSLNLAVSVGITLYQAAQSTL